MKLQLEEIVLVKWGNNNYIKGIVKAYDEKKKQAQLLLHPNLCDVVSKPEILHSAYWKIKKIKNTRNLIVLDCETSGLDFHWDCILQIAAQKVDENFDKIGKAFSSRICPTAPISEEAQKINGLTLDILKNDPKLPDVLTELTKYVGESPLICGQNSQFDRVFINEAYYRAHIKNPFSVSNIYKTIDLHSIAYFVFRGRGYNLNSYKLDDLCEFFNLKKGKYHDALEDIELTRICFKKMRELVNIFFTDYNIYDRED